MPLLPTFELRLGLGELRNLELLRKGLYRVRVRFPGSASAPVSCSAHPSRLGSISRSYAVPDSDLGAENGQIDEELGTYESRSCFVRYVDEGFDLSEVVTFRCQGAAADASAFVAMRVELLRADCELEEEAVEGSAASNSGGGVVHGVTTRFGRVRRVVRRSNAFAAVASRTLLLPAREAAAGLAPFGVACVFDTNNLASVSLTVHSVLLRVTFIAPASPLPLPLPLPSPPPPPSSSQDVMSGLVSAFAAVWHPEATNGVLAPASRAFLETLRIFEVKPQRLSEILFPSLLRWRVAVRAARRDRLTALIAARERGECEDNGNVEAALRASVIDVAAGDELHAVPASEAQEAHARLLRPLLRARCRLAAVLQRVHSRSGASPLPLRELEEAAWAGVITSLRDACVRLRYAPDGSLERPLGQEGTTSAPRDADDEVDAFGLSVSSLFAFAVRAAPALADAEALARCLEQELEAIAELQAAAWSAAQRELARRKASLDVLLQSDLSALAARFMAERVVSPVALAGASSLLESPVPIPPPPPPTAVTPEEECALGPVLAAVPAAVHLLRIRVGSDSFNLGTGPPVPSSGAHLVVFVNGLGGSVHDTRLLRAHLKLQNPALVCYACTSVQGADSDRNIIEGGARVAHEVDAFVRERLPEDGLFLAQLSFVGFSLGGLVARAAMRHPLVRPLLERCGRCFVSLATPHLGVQFSSPLVTAGMYMRRQMKASASLSQLALLDAERPRDCLLYLLAAGWEAEDGSSTEGDGALAVLRHHGLSSESNGALLSLFRRVVLVASRQDSYTPYDSCLAQLCRPALEDLQRGPAYIEAARSFYGVGSGEGEAGAVAGRFAKLEARFLALDGGLSFDSVVGRDAHVAFLESEAFACALAHELEL